jgi:hypothetical protein
MVVSTHAIIPYDQGQYSILPVRTAHSLVVSEDRVERHYRFFRPPTAKKTAADPGDTDCHRYNRNQHWQFANDYQVGGRIDVYA